MSGDIRVLNDTSLPQAAAAYAAAGWAVLPVWWVNEHGVCACRLGPECADAGKHPMIERWQDEASTDLGQVAEWWRNWPTANIGVHCARSGFLALDIDQDKVMLSSWPVFATGAAEVPSTLVQRSGAASEAHHVLFATGGLNGMKPRGKVVAPGAPGVDKILIRHNGYIIVAPSLHRSGNRYRWVTGERITPVPAAILPMLTMTPGAPGGSGDSIGSGDLAGTASYSSLVLAYVNRAAAGESRASAGFDLACQLRDARCSKEDAERVWLPTFYREVVGMRHPGPDPDIIRRWLAAWDVAPRAPLPAFDPNVQAVQAAFSGQPSPSAPEPPPAGTPPVTPTAAAGQPDVFAVVGEPIGEENATDDGNAFRFARLHGSKAIFNLDEHAWYVWDGLRWRADPNRMIVTGLVRDVVSDVRGEALNAYGADRDRWLGWAHTSESVSRMKATVELAATVPQLQVRTADFDRNPWLLVVKNGVIDLQHNQLLTPDPADRCTQLANVIYDPAAEAPRWREHIRFVAGGDVELACYLRRAAGYSMTGKISERAFFYVIGDGSNGKNVFIEPIMDVLGSYATTANGQLITGGDEHPTGLADLQGKRMVFVDETRAGKRINAERIKMLTGSKTIKARKMHKDFYEFEARLKLWMAGNGHATVRDPSDGIWTRLQEIEFGGKVGREVVLVKDLGQLLFEAEASGILNWMLAGLHDPPTGLLDPVTSEIRGLGQPASVAFTGQEHRDEEDFLGQFIDAVLEITSDRNDFLSSKAVFDEYREWMKGQLLTQPDVFLSQTKLTRELNRRVGPAIAPTTAKPGGRASKSVRGWFGMRWGEDATREARAGLRNI